MAEGTRPSSAAHGRSFTAGDMLRSLAVVFILVGIIVVFLPRSHEDSVRVIDTGPVLKSAQRAAPYDVRVPTGLRSEWRPTSARVDRPDNDVDPIEVHIGYVTPSNEYAGLEQSNGPQRAFISLESGHGRFQGSYTVAGEPWPTYYAKDRDARTLARTFPDGVTVVVTGTASYAELAELAASLT